MRSSWFVEDPDNDPTQYLMLDFDTDRVHLQVRQPGWPGLIDSYLMNDVWEEIVGEILDMHPRLGARRALAGAKAFDRLWYDLSPAWQSIANLVFMIGASGVSDQRSDIINAWRKQPAELRTQSWLRNCSDPAVAAAQLLATIKTPSPIEKSVIEPWVRRVIGENTAQEQSLSSGILSWVYADTPLGITCAPQMELVEDEIFMFASPVLTDCDVWLGVEYLKGARIAQASLDFLEYLAEVSKENGWRQTGHEVLGIARDMASLRASVG